MIPTMASVIPHARQRRCRHCLLVKRPACHGGAAMVCRWWRLLEANSRVHTNLIRLVLYSFSNFRRPCTWTVSGRMMLQFQAVQPTLKVRLVEVGIARPISWRCFETGWHSHSRFRVNLHRRRSTRRCARRSWDRPERLDAGQSQARLRLCWLGHRGRWIWYVVTVHCAQLARIATEATAVRMPCPSPPWIVRNAGDRVSSSSPTRVGHGGRRDEAAARR